jgi:conjugal transfer pilus assembly protein TrbC
MSLSCFSQTTLNGFNPESEEVNEQKEVQKVKEIITSQFGFHPRIALHSLQGACLNCSSGDEIISLDSHLLVFVSFSIPDHAWISLSKELEKIGGIFVLRGLPQHSFQALATRILTLKAQGVNAPIQLDPKSFITYEITQVPTIVVADKQTFDKVAGHVSIKFALEQMAKHGESKKAKILYQTFKDQI